MLQAHTYATVKPCSIPTQSSIFPNSIIPLRRASSTFTLNLPPPFSVNCFHPDLFHPKPFPSPPQRPPSPTPTPIPVSDRELPPRVYVGHSVYKGKAVLTVAPRPPEFTTLDSGSFKVSREGCVLLQFAPAVGVRQYDWNRKQVFSLSVSEMGTLISLGARESCEFFHDPFMGKSGEGNLQKFLKVEPLQDNSGHLFNLSVQNKLENINERIFIPITKAEFAVFSSIFNFIMPCCLGWNAFANSIKPEVYIANPRKEEDYEWNR